MVTVIVATPAAFAVTTPEDETAATEVLEDFQVTDLSVAFSGATVAVRVSDSPSISVREVWSSDTPVTGMIFALTVT